MSETIDTHAAAPPQPARNGAAWTDEFRAWIYERDSWTCAYCRKVCDEAAPMWQDRPQIDHVVPRRQGGSDDPDNLATSCAGCNVAKGDRTPAQWLADTRAKDDGRKPAARIRPPRARENRKMNPEIRAYRDHLQEHFGHYAFSYARCLTGITPLQKLACYYMATAMGSSGVYSSPLEKLAAFCCCPVREMREAMEGLQRQGIICRGMHPDEGEWGWVFPYVWIKGGYFNRGDAA